ncbi:LacI family DNA-binding transcriptional regulator [Agrobacterium sp. rho-13.3]|uniref:LacI family DNA-binding transcriptional regulator n=1 Tax=Agrobacterium sp. rho-13.3 TaxID=3072980 RepID=UPI002A17E6C3|nr:LacI family DNA-binding transcriptional regulator [Agrobacterium sp. rho-13.3]MDX8307586.1 LacI family DNA-binding transcriptional regulator [Agrobacterium sp. rho-13.3]
MNSGRTGANLTAIASALNVSTATVSNALSGKGRVSAELTEKVRQKAAELGYVPSVAGRALRTGKSGVLGLVLPDIANPLFPQIAQAIEKAAAAAGYGVLIADSHGDVAMQTQAINRLIERGVEGMVVVPRRGTRIGTVDCPVAVIDSPSTPGNTVSADHWEGGHQVGRHLAELGHDRVVIIGNNPDSNVQNDRIGGIRSGLTNAAHTEIVWISALEKQNGAGCPLGVADKVAQGFTAFAAVSDLHALRVLTELQRDGINVPEQATVTGFDDLIWAPVVTPALTTIRMDMARIADVAITALVRSIDMESPDNSPVSGGVVADISKVVMELIVRHSSGPNNKKQANNKTSTAGERTS